MSFTIIDRRMNGKGKSLDNRQKFLKRIRESIKKSLPDIINKGKLKDVGTEGGVVHVPQKDLNEPSFRHGEGGVRETVRPGNKEFNEGDKFRKPQGGQGQRGKKASNEGSGEDDFTIEISREEFLNYFFEDLELPDLVKAGLKEVTETKWHNAGFTSSGSPAKLDRSRTLRKARSRQMTSRSPYKKRLKEAQEQHAALMDQLGKLDVTNAADIASFATITAQLQELEKKIEGLKRKIENVPFLDPVDLRYRASVSEEIPITSAVMFCIMDNSGSMGEFEKTLSRKFFVLLYMFLARNYQKITLRFIFHTTYAKEVDEEEFFNTRESGGTVVSSALIELNKIIEEDYADGSVNLYVCQCSDGDNWYDDNQLCYNYLVKKIMPMVQYYAYIEVGNSPGYVSDVWDTFAQVNQEFPNFQQKRVYEDSDIYPVFKKLFEKKDAA